MRKFQVIAALVIVVFLIGFIGCSKNSPPVVPTLISPSNNATGISKDNLSLKWSCDDPNGDALSYHVYFGTSNPPSFVTSTDLSNYSVTNANYSTQYYWQVVAFDGKDSTESPVWSFTTGEEPNSSPAKPEKLITDWTYYAPNYDTVKISGKFPSDPNGDLMYYRYDDGNGHIGSWSSSAHPEGDSASLGSITYTNPSQDTGTYYGLKWQVKDTHGNESEWSDTTMIAVAHIGAIVDSYMYIDDYNSYSKYFQMWNNGYIWEIYVTLEDGSNFNATLYDPDYNVSKTANNVSSVYWGDIPVNSSNAGQWSLWIETTGQSHVDVYISTIQLPPGANLGAFKPFVGKSRKSLK